MTLKTGTKQSIRTYPDGCWAIAAHQNKSMSGTNYLSCHLHVPLSAGTKLILQVSDDCCVPSELLIEIGSGLLLALELGQST